MGFNLPLQADPGLERSWLVRASASTLLRSTLAVAALCD